MKVLFYTHTTRLFRTALITYLYEIAQVHPVILLAEELDKETEKALANKKLFPKLEKIIPVRQFSGPEMNLFKKNRYLFKLAKDTVEFYKPDAVILLSDMQPMFELYLSRFAKRNGATLFVLQLLLTFSHRDEIAKWGEAVNAHLRTPAFLPIWLRIFLMKCRKYLGHFLYYWILPAMVFKKPLLGKSSSILLKGIHGMRDADYQIVISENDYEIYKNIYKKYGVSVNKLRILKNPLLNRATRDAYEKIYSLNIDKKNKKEKAVSIMLTTRRDLGIAKDSLELLVDAEKRENDWVNTVKLIIKTLPGWKIYIKPHPMVTDAKELKNKFESISSSVEFIDPAEPVEKYIKMGDIIIGFPLSMSSTLVISNFLYPEKPVISLDFFQEMLGDSYKDFPGIEYIKDRGSFVGLLEKIKKGDYTKKITAQKINKGLSKIEFDGVLQMLEKLLKR